MPVLLLAFAQPGAALPPNLSLSQFQHTAWPLKQGGPAAIWALAQSPDGFLLVGTGSGLYRFDGVTFEPIVSSNQPDLAFRDITALLALPSGEIWIGYYAGGVSELKNGVLTSYGRRDGLPAGWITSFARESDGTLWVAAREGLGRFSGGHWETVSSDWKYSSHAAHWVLLDREGTLWVAGGETVEFLRRGAHQFEDTGIHSGYAPTLVLAPDGAIWLGGESVSPRPLLKDRSQRTPDEPVVRLDPVKRFLVDRDGSIWGTDAVRGGIYRATPPDHDADAVSSHPSIEMFTEADGLSSDIAVPMLEDHEGNIWVGTGLGLTRFRATRFVRESCVPISPTGYALAAEPDGSMWIASRQQLFRAHGSRCDLVATVPAAIKSAYRGPNGALWLGTRQGVVELLDKNLQSLPLPAPAESTQYEYVHAMTSDSSHGLWVSVVNRGLLQLDDRRWELAGSGLHLPQGTPTALWTDAAGQQWLGYDDGTAALRVAETTRVFGPDQGLQVGPIMVIRGNASEIFVGGEWGLARFDGRRFRSLSASRSDVFSGISGIIVRANGDVWLNGNRGVVHMSADALNDAYEHPLAQLRYDLFDVHDGLPGEAQQGEDASAVAAADGRLWFVTSRGVAWIDPDHLVENKIPPRVVIRSVLADQRAYPIAGAIELPQATRSVRIDYTALSLGEPERVRFRYKLEGADDTWRDAGNERSVRYASLRPGNYTFRVIASNSDGVWNEEGAKVAFTLPPAFYQTKWFYTLCALAGIALLYGLYRVRLRQIAAQVRGRVEARLAERERIAQDLHDTVLQGLLSVSMQMAVANRKLRDTDPVKRDFTNLLGSLTQVAEESRNAVRGLRNLTAQPETLADALARIPQDLAAEPKVRLRVRVEGEPCALKRDVQEEVYLISREAIANAFRHAKATVIDAVIRYSASGLDIAIRDNGVGIGPGVAAEGRLGHFGLRGMRERAARIEASLHLGSTPDTGTAVELFVPASVAFESSGASRLDAWLARRRVAQ